MEGGDTNPYQLEGLSPKALESASGFMHSQSSWCGGAICISIIYTIFAISTVKDLTKIVNDWQYLPKEHQKLAQQIADSPGVKDMSQHVWVQGILSVLMTCCFGGCVVGISRKALESKQFMQCCMCIDACASCLYCLNGTAFCIGMVSIIGVYNALGNPTELCRTSMNAMGNASTPSPTGFGAAPTTTIGAAGTNQFAKNPALAACSNAVDVFKNIIFTMSIFFCLMGCCFCGQHTTCGAGAKFAKETVENLEDGGGYDQDYDQPGNYYG